jgi:hypothetical protein
MVKMGTGMVDHICNPSYMGGKGRRIKVQGQPRRYQETIKKNTKTKRRKCGSSGRVLTWQAGGSEFKPQYKKKKVKIVNCIYSLPEQKKY